MQRFRKRLTKCKTLSPVWILCRNDCNVSLQSIFPCKKYWFFTSIMLVSRNSKIAGSNSTGVDRFSGCKICRHASYMIIWHAKVWATLAVSSLWRSYTEKINKIIARCVKDFKRAVLITVLIFSISSDKMLKHHGPRIAQK